MPRAKKSMNATPVLKLDTDLAGALAVTESTDIDVAFDKCIEQARADIRAIDEKAEFAIQVVTQSIRTQASVAKGKVLLQLRERFDQIPALEGKWSEFLDSEDINSKAASRWMAAAKLVKDQGETYGEDFLLNFGAETLTKIHSLPGVIKEAVLEDAADTGDIPTQRELNEITSNPKTKLAKAMEQMEALAERQSDPERSDKLKSNDRATEKKLEETIEQLKSQIAEDKIKSEMEAKEKERITAELELLKYDDDAAREQRIKRVSNTLIVSIPAVLSDLQKYIAEKDHYDGKTTKSLDDSIETLVNYLKPLYA